MSLADFHPTYLRVEQIDDATVQAWFTTSKLADDVNIEQMGHELTALLERYNVRRLIISFAKVEYLTRAALGKLITLHRRLHRAQGSLVMCEIGDSVMDIMRTSRLEKYFRIVPDREAALAALAEVNSSPSS